MHTTHETTAVGAREVGRVLFLGNEYNPLSIAVALTLADSGAEVIVGVHDAADTGLWRVFRRSLQQSGARFVARKAALLAQVKAQRVLGQAGVTLRGAKSLTELCRLKGLETLPCRSPNAPAFVRRVRELEFDLIVVCAFSRILKAEILAVPRLGCVNVHPSLLPKYRGPNPLYWVLEHGEKVTGVTLHYMDEGIDSGDLVSQVEVPIGPAETERTLQARSARAASSLLKEWLPRLLAGDAAGIQQDEAVASYFPAPPRGRSAL